MEIKFMSVIKISLILRFRNENGQNLIKKSCEINFTFKIKMDLVNIHKQLKLNNFFIQTYFVFVHDET